MPTPIRAPRRTPAPRPAERAVAAKPVAPNRDRDRDGVVDRYDASPDDARDRRWNRAAAQAYAEFVPGHLASLQRQGVEIDCADLAGKLIEDFCAAVGLPNPLAGAGTWHRYAPDSPGGLPNVLGPTYFNAGLSADKLAKRHVKAIGDEDGDGVAGWDRATGRVDVADMRPGDMLFYDWNGDGKVDHTVNVVGVEADGTVALAYGTYDNLGDKPLVWENLDILPIQRLKLKPGTEDYAKWLGAPGATLWGVMRFAAFSEAAEAPRRPASPAPKPTPEPHKSWLRRLGEWLGLLSPKNPTPESVRTAKAGQSLTI